MTLNWSSQYAPVDAMTLTNGKLVLANDYDTIDPYFDDVSILLKGEGANGSTTIVDSSNNNNVVTANGDAQISTGVATPFSPTVPSDGVLAFDGTGDYLQLPVAPDLTMGAGDFTIECWINLSATGAFDGVITEMRSSGATATGFVFNTRQVTTPSSGFRLNFYTSGASNLGNSILAYNQWHHLALSRSGSTVRLFANGTLDNTPFANSSNFSDNPSVTIGQSLLYPSSNITGYISNLRITKGVARYTANFTPPTQPFFPRGAS